jgi:hypothetical protein
MSFHQTGRKLREAQRTACCWTEITAVPRGGALKSRLDKVQTMFGDPQEKLRFFTALESHGIDEAAREAIQSGNLAEFVQARETQLQRQEDVFLKKFDLSIGDAVERSEDEVDVDEE